LNIDLNISVKYKKDKGLSNESEIEYTDISTGSTNEYLKYNIKNENNQNTNNSETEKNRQNSNKKTSEEKSNEEELNSESFYDNVSINPNFDKIKEIIPEPLFLQHLASKSNNLITLQNSFNISCNKNEELDKIKNLKISNSKKEFSGNKYTCVYDMIIEGKNQHSLWLLFSCLASVAHHNFNIYKSVLTHGYILDSLGKEISEKNFKDAMDIVDGTFKRFSGREYGNGADSLRLYFLRHSFDLDYKLYEEDILKSKADIKFYRKIAKTCLALLGDYDIVKIEKNLISKIKVSLDEIDILDQIMYYEYVKYYEEANKLIEALNISELINQTFNFLKKVFDNYYMDSAKFTIVNYKKNDFRRLIKQFIIKEVIFNVTKILYPLIPFNTEDVYSHMYFLTEKKQFLGFEEFISFNEVKSKLNLNLTDFQRVNYEFKSKNILDIKNKFLYLFNAIVEKANLKNKLKETEYLNEYNESDFDNFNPNKQEEKFNIKDLSQVSKITKDFEDKRRNKLKINLIENDPYNNNKQEVVIYSNDLFGSKIVESNLAQKE